MDSSIKIKTVPKIYAGIVIIGNMYKTIIHIIPMAKSEELLREANNILRAKNKFNPKQSFNSLLIIQIK